MAETRLSPAGEQTAGYTLVELLVVLTVIGLLIAAAPAILSAARPGVEAKTAAQNLANDLRAARTAAVAGDSVTRVVVDAPTKSYVIEPGRLIHRLSPALTLALFGPHGEAIKTRTEFRFYPDGSSTGGSIGIAEAGQRHWVVDHWLTGRITVDE